MFGLEVFGLAFLALLFHRSAVLLAAGNQGLKRENVHSDNHSGRPCCSSSVPPPDTNFRPASRSVGIRWPGCRRSSPTPIAPIAE